MNSARGHAKHFKALEIFTLVFLTFIPASWARLGETFDQVQSRYGLLTKVDNVARADYPQYVFSNDGLEIRVRFVNGKSAQEIFTGTTDKLQTVAAQILNSNAQGSTWSSTAVGKTTEYLRAGGNATAQYTRPRLSNAQSAVLRIQTTEFNRAFNPSGAAF